MSRIGKLPVPVPQGVEVAIAGQQIQIKGKLGELSRRLPEEVEASREDDQIWIRPRSDSDRARAMWGLARTLVANMVRGISQGFSRTLEINGVGYRAAAEGNLLSLQLGFSHEIRFAVPSDIKVQCPKPTEIVVSGADKQKVGQIAADIRALRKPEPYKGKGIKYAEERLRRKEGKKK